MHNCEEYKAELDKLRMDLENDNDVQSEVIYIENQIKAELENLAYKDDDQLHLELLQEIARMKREFDFYDQEGELDMMFPDRHDEDFDEDSMSYNSVFGDD
ncbi:hypothetical protein EGI11_02525 [Chryseobacterium sp. H3056]|uniref:Uncharacterized protein n=1 Tax=Kaistella daneshvariae TaxID=2487074 RepID=A0A3N0X068_9FLAO|nr:hypothetical protein [Kaistella daneshvariae]ROI10786.1 hypothetical protein EGI11_02525 [Kaistella daneshvariae]